MPKQQQDAPPDSEARPNKVKPTITLDGLDPFAFQHLVNALAIRHLGPGLTFFGEGPDGGRDALFEGTAPYPSTVECWSGRWYIQSKFKKPGESSKDPQKWLQTQIKNELDEFGRPNSRREWPDIWLVVTNVNPSPVPKTGTHDVALAAVAAARPELAPRFHIWGKDKIVELLNTDENHDLARRYLHLTTPGDILAKIAERFDERDKSMKRAIRRVILDGFRDQVRSRLEEAGAEEDRPPPIHEIFVDLPFQTVFSQRTVLSTTKLLASTLAENHRYPETKHPKHKRPNNWSSQPARASVWFIKAGPGHGKSTIGQMISQVQRAALIRSSTDLHRDLGPESEHLDGVKTTAATLGLWPRVPRVPLFIDLKRYAVWLTQRREFEPGGLRTFMACEIERISEEKIDASSLPELLGLHRWLVIFDGLDEVPTEKKDRVAEEISRFVRECRSFADLFTICTSRPQGYAGQFDALEACATIGLTPLNEDQAMACGQRLLSYWMRGSQGETAIGRLRQSFSTSSAVRDLMRTPLQVHIMAVIIRNGQTPPERRWHLFDKFFRVIRQREANRRLPNAALSKFLRTEEKLLREIHGRLAFYLHASAEAASGAQAELDKDRFEELVRAAVAEVKDDGVEEMTAIAMEAAKERLVLITTPTKPGSYSFDVRQLQEFFAAEHVHRRVDNDELRRRLRLIVPDQHWREVTHFVLSALIENEQLTPIEIAAAAIDATDNGDAGDRTFHRTLSAGAFHTCRLLEDGVLDHDKVIRKMFERTLTPLFTDAVGQSLFASVEGSLSHGSRRWLTQTCIAWCGTLAASRRELVMYSLWRSTSDKSPDLPNVQKALACLSTSSLTGLTEEFFDLAPARWHVQMLRDRLQSDHTTFCFGEIVEALLLLTSQSRSTPEVLMSLLRESGFASGAESLRVMGPPFRTLVEVELGGKIVCVVGQSEVGDENGKEERNRLTEFAAGLPRNGWLGVLRHILEFIVHQDQQTWRDLCECDGVSTETAQRIRAVFAPSFGGLAEGLRPSETMVFADVFAHGPDTLTAKSTPWSDQDCRDFDELAAKYPAAAVRVGVQFRNSGYVGVPRCSEVAAAIKLLEFRSVSLSGFDLPLLQAVISDDGFDMRTATAPARAHPWRPIEGGQESFEQWAEDAKAVFQVQDFWAPTITSLVHGSFARGQRKIGRPPRRLPLIAVAKRVGVLAEEDWRTALQDTDAVRSVRQAACLWLALSAADPSPLYEFQSELFGNAEVDEVPAHLTAARVLVAIDADRSAAGRSLVSRMLQASHTLGAKSALRWSELVDLWREESSSPITHNAQDLLVAIIPG